MSGETDLRQSPWTVDTLKHLHDVQIAYERQVSDERDKRYAERWKAQETAAKALKEYQNEFRGSLNDVSTKQATKMELETAVKNLNDKIDAHSKQLAELRSRLDIGNPAVQTIQQQLANSAGAQQQSQITMGKLYAAIGAVGAGLGIIVLLANNVF